MAEEIHIDECELIYENHENHTLIGFPPTAICDKGNDHAIVQYVMEMVQRMRQREMEAENDNGDNNVSDDNEHNREEIQEQIQPNELNYSAHDNLLGMDTTENDGGHILPIVVTNIVHNEDQDECHETPINVDETNDISQASEDCEDSRPI